MSQAVSSPWSLGRFLEWEGAQPQRHEYASGVIVAMTGGTLRHNATVNPMAAELERGLADTPCRVFRENVKLVTPVSTRYPDVRVTCTAIDVDTDCVQDADLMVEVPSQSTEPIDRTEKAAEYRRLSSLRAYVIVDTNGQSGSLGPFDLASTVPDASMVTEQEAEEPAVEYRRLKRGVGGLHPQAGLGEFRSLALISCAALALITKDRV